MNTPSEMAALDRPLQGRRKRILVVDDEVSITNILAKIFHNKYDVLTAHDGIQAWEIYQRRTVDLVLSDLNMPRLHGVGLYEKIRATGRGTPVVFMTGYVPEELESKVTEYGNQVLRKPFDLPELLSTVKRYMQ